MNRNDFIARNAGRIIRAPQGFYAFVPKNLPPALEFSADLVKLLSRADTALSELSSLGRTLPNPHLLIASYVRREAVLSSQRPGGRRENLSVEREAEVLAPFLERARQGGILVVPQIKAELEVALGRSMALSSVYHLLHRHGWRKLAPDKRPPQAIQWPRKRSIKTPRRPPIYPNRVGARRATAPDVPRRSAFRAHQRVAGLGPCPSRLGAQAHSSAVQACSPTSTPTLTPQGISTAANGTP